MTVPDGPQDGMPRGGAMSPESVRRWVIEFAVIVVGVLAALAAEASWSYRLERVEEREALSQLLDDFHANADRLESLGTVYRQRRDASRELLALSGRLGLPVGGREPAELLVEAGTIQTLDPVNGTLNSLLASGKLGILRSDSLRAALAQWPSTVEDLAANERWAIDFFYDRLWPYLAEQRVWLDAMATAGRLDGGDNVPAPPDLASVISDPEFQELLGQQINALRYLLLDLDMVGAHIDRIIQLIENH